MEFVSERTVLHDDGEILPVMQSFALKVAV